MRPLTLHYYITAASITDYKSSTINYLSLLVFFDYTECFTRNLPYFRKTFLKLHDINITKNT